MLVVICPTGECQVLKLLTGSDVSHSTAQCTHTVRHLLTKQIINANSEQALMSVSKTYWPLTAVGFVFQTTALLFPPTVT